jgi:hypothetical protein
MRDFLADWNRWSGTERAAALIVSVLFTIVLSALLVAAASPVRDLNGGWTQPPLRLSR